jgi:hypothetical protein
MSIMDTVPGGAEFHAGRTKTARSAKRRAPRERHPGGGEGASAARAPDIIANGPVSGIALIAGLGQNDGPSLVDIPRLPRLLYEPAEAEQLLTVSHATLYRLIRAGRLDAKKIGSKTVITAPSIERFIAGLPAVVGAPRQPEPPPVGGKMGAEADGKGLRPRSSQSRSLRRRDRVGDHPRAASSG